MLAMLTVAGSTEIANLGETGNDCTEVAQCPPDRFYPFSLVGDVQKTVVCWTGFSSRLFDVKEGHAMARPSEWSVGCLAVDQLPRTALSSAAMSASARFTAS